MAHIYTTNFIAACVFIGIAILLTATRFASYPRKIRKQWTKRYRFYNQVEKWFMIFALAAFGLFVATVWIARSNVQSQVTEGSRYSEGYLWHREFRKLDHSVGNIGYAVCFTLCRVVVITMYRRFWHPRMEETNKPKYIAQAFLVLNLAWMIATIVFEVKRCSPSKKAFIDEEPGTCIDQEIFITTIEVLAFALNIFLLIFPIPYVHFKALSKPRKTELAILWITGLFVGVISLAQLTFAWGGRDEPIEQTNSYFLWRAIQITFAFVCCWAAPFRAFFPGYPGPGEHGIPLQVLDK